MRIQFAEPRRERGAAAGEIGTRTPLESAQGRENEVRFTSQVSRELVLRLSG